MLKHFKNIVTERGILLTVVLAMCCMVFFFGKLLQNPNQVYFGATDDGIQAYYGALYHVKYDTAYWHMNGMNYPYGDQVFFTGCQPFVSNPIKLISTVIDISNYTLGILNIIMLFSIFFCAVCLYLIFKHLRLPYAYSAIAATAISFLSPQIIRLACHYSLTYQFAIPLFLLLVLKFHQSPTIKKSVFISFLVFFMAGTHFYFFGFFALIAAFYWAFVFFSKKITRSNFRFVSLHAFIQIGLPFLLFQIITFLIDNVHDRTNNPWGYLTYISNLTGVFYPFGKPYEPFYASFIKPEHPYTMEGFSYVGIVATIVSIVLTLVLLKRIFFFEFKKIAWITDHPILNIFCWASVFALILSFGYPFKIRGYENWLQYVGLLKQMRGIARFSWAFYYIINIVAFYKVYQWMSYQNHILKKVVLTIALVLICLDAYYMASPVAPALNNRIARLEDKENILEEDKWLNEINTKDYQAIITLPYFHVGSESIWMIRASEIIGHVYITSLKTGLPTTSSVMSRTSLSQTYNNIPIILEPYRKLKILNDLKSQKPFLVLAIEQELNADEKQLLTKCKKLNETSLFSVYELPFEALLHRTDSLYVNTVKILNNSKTYTIGKFKYTDSIKTFVYNTYNEKVNLNTTKESYYLGRILDYNLVFNDTLPNYNEEQEYSVSFWMGNFTQDLYPRASCVLECIDSTGASYNRTEFGMHTRIRTLDGDNALIECPITIKNKNDHLAITIWHYEIFDNKKMIRISDLLIRPSKDTLYKKNGTESIMFNNRTFLAE
ncbi:MAG: hypothetical protein V4608_03805 [Bacteroidota bacterium]